MSRLVVSNARPMDYTRGLQPMAREDETFWRRRRGEPVKARLLQRIFGRS